MKSLVQIIVILVFSWSNSTVASEDEDTGLFFSAHGQVAYIGKANNVEPRFVRPRLTLKTDKCTAIAEIDVWTASQSSLSNSPTMANIACVLDDYRVRVGLAPILSRMSAPYYLKRPFVLPPVAVPTKIRAYVIRVGKELKKNWLLSGEVTSESGFRFNDSNDWSNPEFALRLGGPVAELPGLKLGFTGQFSRKFERVGVDAVFKRDNIKLQGAAYINDENDSRTEYSAYLLGSFLLREHTELSAQIDSRFGEDDDLISTFAIRQFFGKEKLFSFAINRQEVLLGDTRDDGWLAQFQMELKLLNVF